MSINVSILGATGIVGQKVIALLSQEPNFHITELIASPKHTGQLFGNVCDWREPIMDLPSDIANIRLVDPYNLQASYNISCLPTEPAQLIEPILAKQGKIVFSNAPSFRMQHNVPLIIPEINKDHLSLLANQTTSGKLITNPNCAATGATLALGPLTNQKEIIHVSIVTLQSISGAGYPGISSIDITGNTIPYIQGEAKKITEEVKKILGTATKPATFPITTHVHRVPVMYGHVATLHITFKDNITPEEAIQSYQDWNQKHPNLFVLHKQNDRPQSIRDLHHDDMRIHIGSLCQGGQLNILGLTTLSHNLVRGAAGAVIANIKNYLNVERKSYDS
ncbi:Aspartate-semialdehyde dehydrogenase [Candidatus Xenohaliotis californiensis]|uniref:Aspartate-semialdehyde dehydrogenase n=1 Tax=Candidatus Xenohaliotis californiensis TaxID=84677 RepID=A0ABM9N933_9RICK|nr:Aspartate-semialdehyde dehydrogenase [Candidatus Xenohaliotis californiensis]